MGRIKGWKKEYETDGHIWWKNVLKELPNRNEGLTLSVTRKMIKIPDVDEYSNWKQIGWKVELDETYWHKRLIDGKDKIVTDNHKRVFTKQFKLKSQAMKFAMKYMRANPNG